MTPLDHASDLSSILRYYCLLNISYPGIDIVREIYFVILSSGVALVVV